MILLAMNLVLLGVIARSVDRFAEADHETRAAKATRMLLWAFATVVVVQGALGALGLLTPATNLRFLNLPGCTRVTDAGLNRLQSIRSLSTINLTGTSVTAEGVASLRASLPKLQVTWTPNSSGN